MTGDTKDSGTPTSDVEAGTIEEGTESVRRTIVGGRLCGGAEFGA